MKKVSSAFVYLLIPLFCAGTSFAGNSIFVAFTEKISRLEMELKLLDVDLNRQEVLNTPKYRYASRIVSIAGQDTITAILYVFPTIMKVPLRERKNRIAEICSSLFEEYQSRFWMTDPDYRKVAGEIGTPMSRMKSCNMAVYVYAENSRNNLLALWECGSLTFRKDFLKK